MTVSEALTGLQEVAYGFLGSLYKRCPDRLVSLSTFLDQETSSQGYYIDGQSAAAFSLQDSMVLILPLSGDSFSFYYSRMNIKFISGPKARRHGLYTS